jgi:hypothetical protein
MAISTFTRCGIHVAGLLSVFALGCLASVTFAYDETLGFCPPYGTRMPPAEFEVPNGPGKSEMAEFPADVDAYRHEKAGWSAISLGMSKRHFAFGEPTDFDWSWLWNIDNGRLLMVGGQIYRCDTSTLTFRQIPNHPLRHEPKDSLRLFAIPPTAGLSIFARHPDRKNTHTIGMKTIEFDVEQRTLANPGRARLDIWLTNDHRLLTPAAMDPDRSARSMWVRVGQSIETTRWTLHVTRIVFPDLEQGIDGWVEVRVDASQTPKNRPPAPALPELQVAAIPMVTPEQLLEEFSPPVGHRAPPDHLQLPETRGANDRNGFPMQLSMGKNKSGGWSRLYLGGLDIAKFVDLTWLAESEVKDGHLLSIGGQIYRCDTEKSSLTRIADHPLNIVPSDAIRLFAVYPSSALSISATSDESPYLRIELSQFDQDRKTGFAQLRFKVNKAGKRANDQRWWVRAGQVVEIADRILTVTRIVFPDPEQGIDGWVEVRVEPPARR